MSDKSMGLIRVGAFEAQEHDLHGQRARLVQKTLATQSGLGSFTVTDHSKVEKLAQIDAALMRLGDGQYGVCSACKRTITIERLRLMPATLFCLGCAHAVGRARRVLMRRAARRQRDDLQ